MKESIFISVTMTALTVVLFCTGVPELWAVGIFVALIAFYGWCSVFEELDKE